MLLRILRHLIIFIGCRLMKLLKVQQIDSPPAHSTSIQITVIMIVLGSKSISNLGPLLKYQVFYCAVTAQVSCVFWRISSVGLEGGVGY